MTDNPSNLRNYVTADTERNSWAQIHPDVAAEFDRAADTNDE